MLDLILFFLFHWLVVGRFVLTFPQFYDFFFGVIFCSLSPLSLRVIFSPPSFSFTLSILSPFVGSLPDDSGLACGIQIESVLFQCVAKK